MYALRVAAGTRRVLLLRWEHPGNLTDILVPGSGINWPWQGSPAEALPEADQDVFRNNDLGKAFKGSDFFTHELSNRTLLVLKTNFPADQKCHICPAVSSSPSQQSDVVCMFRYLFRPSALVERKTDETLQALYPHVSPAGIRSLDYPAVHLRLGVMPGEGAVINRLSAYVDPLTKLLLSIACSKGLAAQNGMNLQSTPLLLLVDHHGIRQFSRNGGLAQVVTPASDAVHTKSNSVEAHLASFVDLNLMARARCVVLSYSGFSNVGWWLGGGNSCKMMLSSCYKACLNNSTAPFCP
jgi:hypothetical protein